MALDINKEQPFSSNNQNIEYLNFRALLPNGDILYQGVDKYERYQLEKETPEFLSGSYVLTTKGNVYYLNTEIDGYSGIVNVDQKCVYNGGDIVAISASETAARCIGLRENGTVISWSDIGTLDVTSWKNVVAIEQGFNYAVGLTDDGHMLYVDYNKSRTETVMKELEQWTEVIQIATCFDTIVALSKDDTCYFLDLTAY